MLPLLPKKMSTQALAFVTTENVEKMAKMLGFAADDPVKDMLEHWGDVTSPDFQSSPNANVLNDLVWRHRDAYNRGGIGIQVSQPEYYDPKLPSWRPDESEDWINVGKQMLQQYISDKSHNNWLQPQGLMQGVPGPRMKGDPGQRQCLYKLDENVHHWIVDKEYTCITVPLIEQSMEPLPVGLVEKNSTGMPKSFQTGKVIAQSVDVVQLFHGTRERIARLIMRDGLQSSGRSHGVIGTWLTEEREFALRWGATPFDIFPGCAIHVIADAAQLRRNREIGKKKAVAQAEARGSLSEYIALQAITFRIPGAAFTAYRLELTNTLRQDIELRFRKKIVKQRFAELLDLLVHRYSCFSCCLQGGEWGRMTSHRKSMQKFAFITLQILRPMALMSSDKRRYQLSQLHWDAIPPNLQEFLIEMHGESFRELFHRTGIRSPDEIFLHDDYERSKREEPTQETCQAMRDYAGRKGKIGTSELYNSSATDPANYNLRCEPSSSHTEPMNSPTLSDGASKLSRRRGLQPTIGSSELYNTPCASEDTNRNMPRISHTEPMNSPNDISDSADKLSRRRRHQPTIGSRELYNNPWPSRENQFEQAPPGTRSKASGYLRNSHDSALTAATAGYPWRKHDKRKMYRR